MAKKEVNQLEEFVSGLPGSLEFELIMVADSTTVAYVDIDTNLDNMEALAILGCEFKPENKDEPDTPVSLFAKDIAVTWTFQIMRGDDHTSLLNHNHNDLIGELTQTNGYDLSGATGGSIHVMSGPFQVPIFHGANVTVQQKLRLAFVSDVDFTDWSVATTRQLAGKLYCNKLSAPDVGVTKLGQMGNL